MPDSETYSPTEGEYIRDAIANAINEGMDITDLQDAADHAATAEALDRAVNLLAQMR